MDHASFPFEIRGLSRDGQIAGLAAGYGNVDAHGEMFAAGAFSRSLQSGRTVAMLLHHDPRRPAGRWEKFTETPAGLEVVGQLATDATDGREAYALLKAGALAGLSVGFANAKKEKGAGGVPIITEAQLLEVSLVATPSNPLTKITGVKAVTDVRELEEVLREAGFSGRRAKVAAAAAWKAADRTNEDHEIEARAASDLARATTTIANLFRS